MLETLHPPTGQMHHKCNPIGDIVAHPVFLRCLGDREGFSYSTGVEPHGHIPGQVSHQVGRRLPPCQENCQVAIGLPDILQVIIIRKYIHCWLIVK